ncbi:MAG: hypothetical protein ISR65_11260 [Bacteriovoracaceae bacterium]|nr:hypothetical protein [Bacteriovoracaceae bacterium]
MKSLLLLITALLVTTASFATDYGNVIAKYTHGSLGSGNRMIDAGLYKIELTDEQYLIRSRVWGYPVYNYEETQASDSVKLLNNEVYNELLNDIRVLEDAKIETIRPDFVCEMMPLISNDDLEVKRGQSLELVDGPSGCWVPTHVHPKTTYAQKAAALLKRSLKLLSLI